MDQVIHGVNKYNKIALYNLPLSLQILAINILIAFIGFVTLEALVGISCPLTIIENQLRGRETSESFVGYWIRQIFYWDLPADFFMVMYLLCLVGTCYVWKKFPPRGSI